MAITINSCPFCGHDDVEVDEVSISEYAIDCPECRTIGPICGTIMEAIEKWNRRLHDSKVRKVALIEAAEWFDGVMQNDYANPEDELRRMAGEVK